MESKLSENIIANMTIRRPSPRLGAENKRLLELLDQLLASAKPPEEHGNKAANTVVLSDNEAAELGRHFERLLQSREFLEAVYFVDQIYGRSTVDFNALKSIFVAGSKRKGRRAQIMSTAKWHEFLVRLGAEKPMASSRAVQPMSFDHFLRMEETLLFKTLGFDARARDVLLHLVSGGRSKHERGVEFDFTKMRGERLDRPYEPEDSVFRRIKERAQAMFSDSIRKEASSQQLAGLTTLVTNVSVMFTTRDWGVAGTISTMCGAIPLAIIK